MIHTHKKVIEYYIEHGFRNVNNVTSLQLARISLIDENLD